MYTLKLLEEKQKKIKDIYSKILNSEIKQQLLIYMAKEANWVNAYKIYEILKHNFHPSVYLNKFPSYSNRNIYFGYCQ